MKYCRELGFNVLYFREYQGDLLRQLGERRPLLRDLLTAVIGIANAFTLWRKDLKNGDFHILLQKSLIATGDTYVPTTEKQAAARPGG